MNVFQPIWKFLLQGEQNFKIQHCKDRQFNVLRESGNGWGWKGPLEILWSNLWASRAEGSRAPEYRQEQRLHHLSGQPVPVSEHFHITFFEGLHGFSCISICATVYFSLPWAPLRRAWLPLHCFPSDTWTHCQGSSHLFTGWVSAMSSYFSYWLLTLATVHNTKIIIAWKLFHDSGY